MTNSIFAWDNYDEDPNNGIILETIPEQKNASYTDSRDGVFTGSAMESFFENTDKTSYPGIHPVNGMEAGDIVFGEGVVLVSGS
jgi:hypothetical protein